MATNGHIPSNKPKSKPTAIVQVDSLSEDNQIVNPADHDGNNKFILISFFFIF